MTVLTLEQGLTLAALPYSLWIASISSVDRLRAAQKTFGPTDPVKDEENKPSKIKKVVVGVGIFTAYMAIFMGVQRLPAWAFEEGMSALSAMLLSAHATPVLLDILGWQDASYARFGDSRLVVHAVVGFPRLAAQAALTLPFYYYLPQRNSLPYVALAALSMFAVPIGYERCLQKKVVALRWIAFIFVGFFLASFGLCAILVVVFSSDLIPEGSGESFLQMMTGEDEAGRKAEVINLNKLRGFFVFQTAIITGMVSFLVATLYRLDVYLAKKNSVGEVALASDEEEVALLEPLNKLAWFKGPSGPRVPLMSVKALLQKNALSHHAGFFTSLTYAKLASFLTVALMAAGFVTAGLTGMTADLEKKDDQSSFLTQQMALFLSVPVIILATVVLSLVRGQFKEVYAYREVWAPAPKSTEEDEFASAVVEDEKLALLKEEQ